MGFFFLGPRRDENNVHLLKQNKLNYSFTSKTEPFNELKLKVKRHRLHFQMVSQTQRTHLSSQQAPPLTAGIDHL